MSQSLYEWLKTEPTQQEKEQSQQLYQKQQEAQTAPDMSALTKTYNPEPSPSQNYTLPIFLFILLIAVAIVFYLFKKKRVKMNEILKPVKKVKIISVFKYSLILLILGVCISSGYYLFKILPQQKAECVTEARDWNGPHAITTKNVDKYQVCLMSKNIPQFLR